MNSLLGKTSLQKKNGGGEATAYLIQGVSELLPVLLVLLVLQELLHLVNVYMGYNCFYLPCILYHLSINSRPQNVG